MVGGKSFSWLLKKAHKFTQCKARHIPWGSKSINNTLAGRKVYTQICICVLPTVPLLAIGRGLFKEMPKGGSKLLGEEGGYRAVL